jgi:phytoene dehydrogenase-like protein
MTDIGPKVRRREVVKLGAATVIGAATGHLSRRVAAAGESAEYDFIIVGSGHNALVCAAYLVKAGLHVLVLEAADRIGGNTATERLTGPNFLHEPCSNHPGSFVDSLPVKELELDRFGVTFGPKPDLVSTLPFADGENINMWHDLDRTTEEIARFSRRDAGTFRDLYPAFMAFSKATGSYRKTPIGYGPSYEELAMQRPDGGLWLRRSMESATETIRDVYHEEHVRLFMLAFASGSRHPVDGPGTGLRPFAGSFGLMTRGVATSIGGTGSIAHGLARLLERHDCPIVTRQFVTRLVVKNGRCVGVETANGDVFRARRGVVSSASVPQLLDMAPPGTLDDVFRESVRQWKPNPLTRMCAHYALRKPPLWKVGNDWRPAIRGDIMESWDGFIRSMSAARERRVYEGAPTINTFTATVADPSRAPEGQHTLKVLVLYPLELADGGRARWDEIKHEVAARNFEILRKYVRNLEDENIVGSYVASPLDIAGRNINNADGSCHGGAHLASQSGRMRPVPGWASHRMPINGLYLTGAGTHPGGSVTGLPGRNAAWVILDDLGTSIPAVLETAAAGKAVFA